MNEKVATWFLVVSVGVLILSLVVRFKDLVGPPMGSPVINPSMKLTKVAVSEKSIDIGKQPLNGEAQATFILRNAGKENLFIDKIEVSCQCTSGEITKEAIAPGDSVVMTVQYNKKIAGYFFQDVLVYGNFETSPEILSFEGYLVD